MSDSEAESASFYEETNNTLIDFENCNLKLDTAYIEEKVPKKKSTTIQAPVVRRTREERLENLNSVRETSLEKKKELERDKQR
jgi:hypothetical protein